MTWIIVAAVVVAVACVAYGYHWFNKKPTALEQIAAIKPAHEPKYGNPKPPVSAIRNAIPQLKYPYLWESWVDSTPASDVMTLQLVNAANGNAVVARREIDLRSKWGSYRRYSIISDDFFQELICSVVSWATDAALECNYTPERTNYKIG